MRDDSNNRYVMRKCSFCGRSSDQTRFLFAGPNGLYICDRCIDTANSLIQARKEEESIPWTLDTFPTPAEIKSGLDEYVIGQERAKKAISVAVFNHYKRIFHRSLKDDDKSDVELEKSNILLLGPTGTGKTLLARTLAKRLSVPFCIADATVLTEAGYVGEDVENILVRLLQAADYNVAKAQIGIVYIDELDKIGKKGGANPSISRDVSGEGVQQALLKILENTVAHVPPQGGRKHPEQKLVSIDTRDILFICGGAFHGITDIISRRINKKVIGFDAEVTNAEDMPIGELLSKVAPEDLVQYGLIPELVGRLPVSVSLDELSSEALHRVLTEPKNAVIKQYQYLFEMDGVKLEFTDDAYQAIVEEAMTRKTGARALRSIFEKAMTDIMYDIPSMQNLERCVVNKNVIMGKDNPEYYFSPQDEE